MPSAPTLGAWLLAATVVIAGVAMLEAWDERIAWGAAILILLAVFFRYPAAVAEIRKMLGA